MAIDVSARLELGDYGQMAMKMIDYSCIGVGRFALKCAEPINNQGLVFQIAW